MNVTAKRVEEILQRCEKATKGPWQFAWSVYSTDGYKAYDAAFFAEGKSNEDGRGWRSDNIICHFGEDDYDRPRPGDAPNDPDGEFMAASRQDLPDLASSLKDAVALLREIYCDLENGPPCTLGQWREWQPKARKFLKDHDGKGQSPLSGPINNIYIYG